MLAGSQFMAAYPITPASEVMEYMIANISKVNGAVIQTEDEIACCNYGYWCKLWWSQSVYG